jgi:hypothetical protein
MCLSHFPYLSRQFLRKNQVFFTEKEKKKTFEFLLASFGGFCGG